MMHGTALKQGRVGVDSALFTVCVKLNAAYSLKSADQPVLPDGSIRRRKTNIWRYRAFILAIWR